MNLRHPTDDDFSRWILRMKAEMGKGTSPEDALEIFRNIVKNQPRLVIDNENRRER